MADVTNAFKATVKAVKSRLKSQGTATSSDTNILPTSKQRGDFETKARDVVSEARVLCALINMQYATQNGQIESSARIQLRILDLFYL